MEEAKEDHVLASVHCTVFKQSETLEGKCVKIEGYDFNQGVNYPELLKSFVTTGFQASNLGDVIQVINQMADVVVTTTGGIEEDLIKCLASTYKGDFSLPGAYLRSKGLNCIGNLLLPNDNYCKIEDWIIPIFDQMLSEQNDKHVTWTPSKFDWGKK